VILVDTSAWIEFFRGTSDYADRVDHLLDSREVAVCGPVMTELRRGFRSVSDRRKVLPLLAACHWLEQPPALWDEAGDLGFALARRGVTSKSFDLLIATYALSHSVPVLAVDRDFEDMQKAGIGLLLA
jgi:predicted nucleic acid-binding protein